MQNEIIIKPQWKRNHNIIIRARFNNNTELNNKMLDEVAMLIWKAWIFK